MAVGIGPDTVDREHCGTAAWICMNQNGKKTSKIPFLDFSWHWLQVQRECSGSPRLDKNLGGVQKNSRLRARSEHSRLGRVGRALVTPQRFWKQRSGPREEDQVNGYFMFYDPMLRSFHSQILIDISCSSLMSGLVRSLVRWMPIIIYYPIFVHGVLGVNGGSAMPMNGQTRLKCCATELSRKIKVVDLNWPCDRPCRWISLEMMEQSCKNARKLFAST